MTNYPFTVICATGLCYGVVFMRVTEPEGLSIVRRDVASTGTSEGSALAAHIFSRKRIDGISCIYKIEGRVQDRGDGKRPEYFDLKVTMAQSHSFKFENAFNLYAGRNNNTSRHSAN